MEEHREEAGPIDTMLGSLDRTGCLRREGWGRQWLLGETITFIQAVNSAFSMEA